MTLDTIRDVKDTADQLVRRSGPNNCVEIAASIAFDFPPYATARSFWMAVLLELKGRGLDFAPEAVATRAVFTEEVANG